MIFSDLRSMLGALLLLCGLSVLASCDGNNHSVTRSVQSDPGQSEEVLKERIQQRWGTLIERDFASAYGYMTPAYRKLHPLDRYVANFGGSVAWKAVKISDVKVEGVRAVVDLEISYNLSIPDGDAIRFSSEMGMLTKQMKEIWLWADGEWWFFNPKSSSVGM